MSSLEPFFYSLVAPVSSGSQTWGGEINLIHRAASLKIWVFRGNSQDFVFLPVQFLEKVGLLGVPELFLGQQLVQFIYIGLCLCPCFVATCNI